jgi:hypothetical protein
MTNAINVVFEHFGKFVALIIILSLALIGIFKVNIKFDLNAFLKGRKSRHAQHAQHYCPHMEFRLTDEGAMIVSWFESPSGTLSWICKNCKLVVNNVDQAQSEKDGEYWLKNAKAYKKNMKKYNRHAKKSL